jgi:hypothetical protein
VIAAIDGVADRLGAVALPLEPVARPPVKDGRGVRVLVEQARPEGVGEELVVAVPAAPVVESDQEHVAAIEPLEDRATVWPAGDGIAQRGRQSIED